MSWIADTFRHLLGRDASDQRRGLAGLAGHMFGAAPVPSRHPSAPAREEVDVVHFPPTSRRSIALTCTIGLGANQGRELLAVTLGAPRDPEQDRIAWLLAGVASANPPLHGVVPLPDGCLGRSSHTHALVAEPWPLPDLDRPEYERILGARLDLVVPVTAREAAWLGERGGPAFIRRMQAQGIAPHADRPAGTTDLAGPEPAEDP